MDIVIIQKLIRSIDLESFRSCCDKVAVMQPMIGYSRLHYEKIS